jgi:hypothetical protein
MPYFSNFKVKKTRKGVLQQNGYFLFKKSFFPLLSTKMHCSRIFHQSDKQNMNAAAKILGNNTLKM